MIRVARHFGLPRQEIVGARELDLSEYDVLVAVRATAPRQLSARVSFGETLVASGTMTNRIDRLSRRGYVTREPAPTGWAACLCASPPVAGKRSLTWPMILRSGSSHLEDPRARDGANLDAAAALLTSFNE